MKRRQLLGSACGHCAVFSGLGLGLGSAPALAQNAPAWAVPARFTRPDLASDEGGIWALMDREEARLRRSPFRMRDAGLNKYLSDLVCKLGGEHCADLRVYPIRTPHFNASMAPNGMMQLWSGLLLRMENEAQLAAVLSHEMGHFLQRHTLERLRDIKARADFGVFLSLFGVVGLVGQLATIAGGLAFSREHEREADRISVFLLDRAGYDPREAARVWENMTEELRANRSGDPSKENIMFATHPAAEDRAVTLKDLAGGRAGETGENTFRTLLAPLRKGLLEDELKRGRLDESVALLNRLAAREAGSAELLHFRGEAKRLRGLNDDLLHAQTDFEAALLTDKPLAETYRSLGHLYSSQKRGAEARDAWQTYLKLAPDAPDASLIQLTLTENPA